MRKLYHYTKLENAKKIIASKKIKRTTLNVPKDEKPICWLSTNTFNETSAYPNVSIERLINIGYVRFMVKDVKFLKVSNWKKLIMKANISPQMQQGMLSYTEAKSSEWFGTLKDIPLALVQDIEYMDKNQNWVSITQDKLLAFKAKTSLN